MPHPIQLILQPLDGSSYSEATTRVALDVARHHEAEITGLAVIDTPGIRSDVAPADYMYWPLVEDIVRNHRHEASAAMTQAEDLFRSACEVHHISHREMELEGLPAHKILEASSLFDLVVLGQRTFYRFHQKDQKGESVAQIIDRTSTPVLAVPEKPAEKIERVLLAFDGSFGAARTMRDFALFAQPYHCHITVFSSDHDLRQAESCAKQAAGYLEAHGLKDVETVTTRDDPAPHVVDQYLENMDMIVAGIHAKRFFEGKGPGTFTNRMIDEDKTLLFLSH